MDINITKKEQKLVKEVRKKLYEDIGNNMWLMIKLSCFRSFLYKLAYKKIK